MHWFFLLNPYLFNFPDDPYYCGLRARVPNFAKTKLKPNENLSDKKSSFLNKNGDNKSKEKDYSKQRPSFAQLPHPASFSTLYQLHQIQNGMLHGTISKQGAFHRHNSQHEPYMWHAKSFESGIGKA